MLFFVNIHILSFLFPCFSNHPHILLLIFLLAFSSFVPFLLLQTINNLCRWRCFVFVCFLYNCLSSSSSSYCRFWLIGFTLYLFTLLIKTLEFLTVSSFYQPDACRSLFLICFFIFPMFRILFPSPSYSFCLLWLIFELSFVFIWLLIFFCNFPWILHGFFVLLLNIYKLRKFKLLSL